MKSCNDPAKGHLYPGRRFYGGRWRTPEQIKRHRLKATEWRRENREAWSAQVKERYATQKSRIDAIKAKAACRNCGYDDPRALDFHHRIPGEKRFRLAAGKAWSWDAIEAEIAKCDVLCANCHRILHAEETAVAA